MKDEREYDLMLRVIRHYSHLSGQNSYEASRALELVDDGTDTSHHATFKKDPYCECLGGILKHKQLEKI